MSKRRSQPLKMWTIKEPTGGLLNVVNRTRRQAIRQYLTWWSPDSQRAYWDYHHRKGYRAVRVLVAEDVCA